MSTGLQNPPMRVATTPHNGWADLDTIVALPGQCAPRSRSPLQPASAIRCGLDPATFHRSDCGLEPKIAQGWVIVRPAAARPTVFALTFRNRCVVDAGDAPPH